MEIYVLNIETLVLLLPLGIQIIDKQVYNSSGRKLVDFTGKFNQNKR